MLIPKHDSFCRLVYKYLITKSLGIQFHYIYDTKANGIILNLKYKNYFQYNTYSIQRCIGIKIVIFIPLLITNFNHTTEYHSYSYSDFISL